jgi:hypothetical protein
MTTSQIPAETGPPPPHDGVEVACILAGSRMVTDTVEHPFARGDALIEAGWWHAIPARDASVHVSSVFPRPTEPATRTHRSRLT